MITNMTNEEMFEGILVFCANCNLYHFVEDCKFEEGKLKCPKCDNVLE